MPFPSNVPSWHQYNSSSSAKYSALSCLFRLCLFSEQTQHLPCMCTDTHTMASYIWHFHTINRLKIRCGKSGVEFFSTPLVGNLLLLMGVNEFEFHNTNPMTQAEYSLGTMSHLCCYPKLVGTMRFWHWLMSSDHAKFWGVKQIIFFMEQLIHWHLNICRGSTGFG